MDPILDELYQAVLTGNLAGTEEALARALDAGAPAETILAEGLIGAMGEVGRRFENGDYYVPDMLVAARAMQAGLRILQPKLVEANLRAAGKVLIGTVQGDLHDIGKNLVAMMLEGAGYQVIDLGTDVSPATFAGAVQEHGPQVLALSALLTTTMPAMQRTIGALADLGIREQVKVVVGGAPLTESFAQHIGADGYAADAGRAVPLVKALCG